jgi:type VI secretion system protein ImpA
MPLRDDILNPIPGDNPSGQSLRLSLLYDRIKEARREDDTLAQGAWQHERKLADHGQVIQLAQDAIATQSKDLQLAAWLCDSLLRKEGIGGLRNGFALCEGLLDRFWDSLYPQTEDGEFEDRVAPLEWISAKLLIPIKSVALSRAGHSYFQYIDSRSVEYEDAAKSKDQKAAREKALKDGKLAPEVFDKSFGETPRAFYADLETQFDRTVESVRRLDETSLAKFGVNAAPSFTRLQETLEEVRHVVRQLLQKKRHVEPDPVIPTPPVPPPPAESAPQAQIPSARVTQETVPALDLPSPLISISSEDPAGELEAVTGIAAFASLLRRKDASSPAPYLMLRGLRWGELRGSADPAMLEAPPTGLRQQVKRLALESKWRELLELAEEIMALPCSRAWLDLQRLVIEACAALGESYIGIAIAIRSEIRALLQDLPDLIHATLNDETPAANPETQAWLRDLLGEPVRTPDACVPSLDPARVPGWRKKYVDPHVLALEALQAGQGMQAIEILQREIGQQAPGRRRFERKLQLAQVCLAAGKDAVAQPLLDDIAADIDTHKLDDWEDAKVVAGALALLVKASKRILGDTKVRQAMFDRICRLDPVQALSV